VTNDSRSYRIFSFVARWRSFAPQTFSELRDRIQKSRPSPLRKRSRPQTSSFRMPMECRVDIAPALGPPRPDSAPPHGSSWSRDGQSSVMATGLGVGFSPLFAAAPRIRIFPIPKLFNGDNESSSSDRTLYCSQAPPADWLIRRSRSWSGIRRFHSILFGRTESSKICPNDIDSLIGGVLAREVARERGLPMTMTECRRTRMKICLFSAPLKRLTRLPTLEQQFSND
jgi:hypothetical protein